MESEFIRCWREAEDGNQSTRVYYNITNDQWNCADHYGNCDTCPTLQGDPDIAGIGVLIAFMVSVGVTALLGNVFPILSAALLRRTNAIRGLIDPWLENAVSKPIIKRVGRQKAIRWALICYDLVFSLGDQQLTTAIALLVATLKKLYSDQSLSVYHLKLVTNLVCVSTSAFAYALISLRIKHDMKPDHRKGPSGRELSMPLRIFLMLTLAALLLYTGWVAARADALDQNCPASCFQNIPYNGKAAKVWATEYWIFVYYSFVIVYTQLPVIINPQRLPRMLQLTMRMCEILELVMTQLELVMSQVYNGVPQGAGASLVRLFVLFSREPFGVHNSVLLANAFFVYYLYRASKSWREQNNSLYAADIQDEKSWGFGQIVPLFLLIQPILRLLDSISEPAEEIDPEGEVENGTENRTEREIENGAEGRLVARRNTA